MQVAQSNFKKVAGEGAGDVEVLDEQFESERGEGGRLLCWWPSA